MLGYATFLYVVSYNFYKFVNYFRSSVYLLIPWVYYYYYFTYQPLSSPLPFFLFLPPTFFLPPHPLLRMSKTSMEVHNTWHIKLRQDKGPFPSIKAEQGIPP